MTGSYILPPVGYGFKSTKTPISARWVVSAIYESSSLQKNTEMVEPLEDGR